MGLISYLFQNPIAFFLLVIPLLYSVILHEIAHGWVALYFGDDTAQRAGRLSLNPKSHIDPVGALALFLVGFGWARPVPVNFFRLRSSRLALVLVSLAGCATNIFIATVSLALLRIDAIANNPFFSMLLFIIARINIILGSFNLIPIPPLDGSKILMGVAPKGLRMRLAMIEPYGFFILIFLIVTGLLRPLIEFMQSIILSLIEIVFRIF